MRTSYQNLVLIVILALTLGLPALAQPGVRFHPADEGQKTREVVPRTRLPHSLGSKADPLAAVAQLKLSALDREAVAAEDSSPKAEPQPYRIAIGRDLYLTPDTSGSWVQLEDGMQLWRLRVTAREATSVSFSFDRFFLPPSAEMLIYTAREESWIRPFTGRDNNPDRQLWTPLLESDDVVIELKIAEVERGQLELSLARIFHGYRGPGAASSDPDDPFATGESGGTNAGACNVDVGCPEGVAWNAQIRSVARYTFVSNGNTVLCSGSMMNNTSGDDSPLFLTANHCVDTPAEAASVVTYWNYQNAGCRTPGGTFSGVGGSGSLDQFLNGAQLRSTYDLSDMTLLELNNSPPLGWSVYWAGWNRSSSNPNTSVSIHHPFGHEKRIALENQPTTTTSYLEDTGPGNGRFVRVEDWDSGTTEPGSSGSPLLNPNGQVIGHLRGGFAACGNNQPDWYGRISSDWEGGGNASNRLRDWLDPIGTGSVELNGAEQGANQPPQIPAAPTNLSATAQTTSEIDLSWTDNATDETQYVIEFREAGGVFDVLPSFGGPNTIGATITNLQAATTYDFRAAAINLGGQSGYSNVATATTLGSTSPCIEGPATLCLLGDRFRVESSFRTPAGATGAGQAVELTPDTGYFWFFNQDNVEVVVKVRDACVNQFNRFWFFAGGLTNVEVDLVVTDTLTGAVKSYRNPLSTPFLPITDTQAFATCP